MPEIILYSSSWCPYCLRAKALLKHKGAAFTEILVDGNRELRREMEQRSGGYTVPQIFIGGTHIGGCDELYALERARRLDPLLVDTATEADA